jgi:L-lysine 2,3-aminomutase
MVIRSQHANPFRGLTTGYAVLIYAIDALGGGGKIPEETNYVPGYWNGTMTLRDYCRKIYHYHEPGREGSGS